MILHEDGRGDSRNAAGLLELIRHAVMDNREVYASVSNRLNGHAPHTVQALAEMLRE